MEQKQNVRNMIYCSKSWIVLEILENKFSFLLWRKILSPILYMGGEILWKMSLQKSKEVKL